MAKKTYLLFCVATKTYANHDSTITFSGTYKPVASIRCINKMN